MGILSSWRCVFFLSLTCPSSDHCHFPTVAANAARDIGGRLAALTIWGLKAGGGPYAAIAALTNIPATIIGIIFYELFFTDSSRGMFPASPSSSYVT